MAAERGIEDRRDSPTTSAATARSVILQTQGAAKVIADGRRQDGPGRVLGVHLVGSRVGELIAEAQLIYNWDGAAVGRGPAHPPASHPVGGDRRGASRACRKALHVHMTGTMLRTPPPGTHRCRYEGVT